MKALKYRHIFGEPQREKYEQIQPTTVTCDSCLVKVNDKYTGFVWHSGGGGILCVLDSSKAFKVPMDYPMIKGHSASILDFDWYPFDTQYLATSSMDLSIKVWRVPEQFDKDVTESESTLYGHDKKVNLIQFNPSAAFILASGSFDSTLKVWDVTKGEAVFTVQSTAQAPLALEWNYNGSLLGTSWNDKKYRIADPRQSKFTIEVDAHQGTKPQKFGWLGDTGYYLTTGFSKNHEREYSLWNINKPEQPVETKTIDNGSGVLFPVYDDGLGVLYISGKGDGTLKYWEFIDGQLHYLNSFKATNPGRGWCFFPKRSLDVMKCEVMRCAKLEEKAIEYIPIIAPRKSQNFQEDLFPEAPNGEASLTTQDWVAGKNANPKLGSLKPEGTGQVAQKQQQQQVQFQQSQKPQAKQQSPENEIVN